jgi:hypothetical protein
MRDNLIKEEFNFDHVEFMKDIIGDLIDLTGFFSLSSSQTDPESRKGVRKKDSVDQGGLIVWGEPGRVESWEVTPSFIRKWAWAMQGCQELIDSTNRWRKTRGEKPIKVRL